MGREVRTDGEEDVLERSRWMGLGLVGGLVLVLGVVVVVIGMGKCWMRVRAGLGYLKHLALSI